MEGESLSSQPISASGLLRDKSTCPAAAHLDAARDSSGGEELVIAVEGYGAEHVGALQQVAVLQRRFDLYAIKQAPFDNAFSA
jgi:hypothetical protein